MRRSPAEIDRAIVDVAAGIFATHGFRNTSVQQIADAVGYSKPGLLHRFGTKEALHSAVIVEMAQLEEQMLSQARMLRADPEHVTRMLEVVARASLEQPGTVRMMLASGRRLVEALDQPAGPMHRLRIALALDLIVSAAAMQRSRADQDVHVPADELVPVLVGLAALVMASPLGAPA